MKAQRTQFDQNGFVGAIATPTCSSSCCCCCCVATVVTASVLVGQEVANSKKVRSTDMWQYYVIPFFALLLGIGLAVGLLLMGVLSDIFMPIIVAVGVYAAIVSQLLRKAQVQNPGTKAVAFGTVLAGVIWAEVMALLTGGLTLYITAAVAIIVGIYVLNVRRLAGEKR